MAHRPVTGSKVAKRNTRFSPKISRGNTLTEREEHAHVRMNIRTYVAPLYMCVSFLSISGRNRVW